MQQIEPQQEEPEITGAHYPIQWIQIGSLQTVPAPLARITLCGRVQIEVLCEVVNTDPPQARYRTITAQEQGKGYNTALNLLKLLACLPGHAATRDWLSEHLPSSRMKKPYVEDEDEEGYDQGLGRVDNVVALLRTLLCPPEMAGSTTVRRQLVTLLKNHRDSGPGYQLATAPLLWLDVDVIADRVQQACQHEQQGQDALAVWEEVYTLAAKGPYLPLERYSDWATDKRAEIEGYFKQAVLALHRLLLARYGDAGEERILLLLRGYWQMHPTDEDVLRPLMELLAKRGCFQEAEEYYHRLYHELELEGHIPDIYTRQTALNWHIGQNIHEYTDESMPLLHGKEALPPYSQNKTHTSFSPLVSQSEPYKPEIRKRLPTLVTQQEQDLESDTSVNRREVSKHLGMFGATLLTAPYRLFDGVLSGSSRHSGIDRETLSLFSTLTDTCLQLSEGNQLAVAERVLWSYLPEVEAVAQQSSEHQRLAASIVSQSYLIAASLVGHHNDLQARQRFSEQAQFYGLLAQDDNLHVAALRQLAVTFDYLERPQKVLQTYHQALPYLKDVSPRLRACIYAALSGVYAQLQQKQEAARFIGLAYEHFPEKNEDQQPFLRLINANYHTLILWDGLNHLELHQPQKAENIFTQLEVLAPTSQIPERIRIELLNYRAKAFMAVNNMEQACTYLEVAIRASIKLGSKRRLRESLTVFQHIRQRWPHEQHVKQLGELFLHDLINHMQ